ncbi:alcohol dehydrogenase [NADP(+)] B isoform X3 [Paramuricea clavata]|uniref:Alcohol dehydrogenase [NADP(+)] B isoform X3 n=1 Tax=Paramuricea clavata TaxID=317549 RepID=A0A7D9EYU1_PARCT|nr:alcohol dehydrogenase [NADP(+)] B isoform X3 [Paramuricea clavata]
MQTLKDLQLDYLDLYLIHWPIGLKSGDNPFPKNEDGTLQYSDVHPLESWQEMEKLVDEGLVRSIGLSNFNSKQVTEITSKGRIKPSVLQVECHPYLNQKDLINFCNENGILVTAFSPLGSPDRPWAKPGDPLLLEDNEIVGIAKKYKKTAAQVCIRFQIERELSVIPKSTTAHRIKENSEVFDFSLSSEDMKIIESFHRPWRACIPMTEIDGKQVPRDAHHPHFPFHEPF